MLVWGRNLKSLVEENDLHRLKTRQPIERDGQSIDTTSAGSPCVCNLLGWCRKDAFCIESLSPCRHLFRRRYPILFTSFLSSIEQNKTKKMGGKNKKEKKSSDIANNRFLNLSSVSLLSTLTIETEPARMEEGKRSSVGYFFVTSDRLWYF